ncbi:MAG TPA: CARDB domain-containing protein [Dehalococcoidia bacterium]
MQDPSGGQPTLPEPGELDEPPERWRFRFSPLTFLIGFGIGAFAGVALAILAYSLADNNQTTATVIAAPQADVPDVVVSGTPQPTPDSRPKSKAALDVRLGPGNGYAVVGSLAKGDTVEIVGRDNDSLWFAIRFPPGSAGQGWIPVTAVDALPDLPKLAVALPTPLPRTISTFPPSLSIPSGDDSQTGGSLSVTRTPNPGGTPSPVPGPVDLVVTKVSLTANNHVAVTVSNRGPGDLVGFTVFAQVRDLGARSETMNAPISLLRAGQTLTLQTSTFTIEGEQTVQAIVDPFGSVPEADKTNNTVQVVLAAIETATPTPGTQAEIR